MSKQQKASRPTATRRGQPTTAHELTPAAPPARAATSPRRARAEPLAEGIKVRAIRPGYYGERRLREGDVFLIADEQAFAAIWMERVDPMTPERITTGQQMLQRDHDETLAERAGHRPESENDLL
jgi:SpoVK/Ycf46/Vps4 family AAA+-type ATPase